MKRPESICKNCLYCGSNGISCGNANNNGKSMIAVNNGNACSWFWLNQHKFPYEERKFYD